MSSVSVSEDGEWCLSSSSDGAAILWRLPAMTRTHLLHASSGMRRIAMTIMWRKWCSGILGGRLHPNNVHALLLTVNNRWELWGMRVDISNPVSKRLNVETDYILRLGFWDTVTGDEIRNIEVTKKGRLTCLDLSLDGKWVNSKGIILNIYNILLLSRYIAVGADDSSVRVLHYDQASTFRIGTGDYWQARVQVPSPSPKSNRKGKEEFGLWAVSKILWATTPPTTFKHEGCL